MSRIIFITILIFAFCAAVLAQADKDACPTIKISVPSLLDVNETGFATAEISEEIEKYDVEYAWTVERGKILEGQGTKKIKILRETTDQVNIILKIKGLPNCLSIAQEAIGTLDRERIPPFDNFEKIPLNDEKKRFDIFFIALLNDENTRALVVFKLKKNESKAKKRKRLTEISRHFNPGKIDKSRFTFMVYEDEEEFTQFWIIPKSKGWNELQLLENKDYKLIKGEEFEQKIDELFPKK